MEIAARDAAVAATIDAQIDALHALLDTRRAELHEQLRTIVADEVRRINELGVAERVAYTVLMTTIPLARQLADGQTATHTTVCLEKAVCERLDELVRAVPTDPVSLPEQVTFELAAPDLEQAIRHAGRFVRQPRRC